MSGLAVLLLLAAQGSADWPTYHGGYSLDGVAAVAPPDAPVRLWRYKAPGPVEFSPVSAEGRIYFVVKAGIHALDLEGRALWSAALEGKDFFAAPPMVTEGRVIAGTSEGKLHAFGAADGKKLWTYDTGEGIRGSANRIELAGGIAGVVVIAQGTGVLHALELESGKGVWKSAAQDRADGSPGVGAARIVMGSCASALHVFSAGNGAKTADVSLGGDCQVAGGVAITGGVAYAGSHGGKLVAVNLAALKILWTNEDTKKEVFTTPAVGPKIVLFGSDEGRLFGLDRTTGKQLWNYDTKGAPSSPVIAGERALVASAGSLHLLELSTGRPITVLKISDEITPPALVGGRIIVGADDGTVSAWGAK